MYGCYSRITDDLTWRFGHCLYRKWSLVHLIGMSSEFFIMSTFVKEIRNIVRRCMTTLLSYLTQIWKWRGKYT